MSAYLFLHLSAYPWSQTNKHTCLPSFPVGPIPERRFIFTDRPLRITLVLFVYLSLFTISPNASQTLFSEPVRLLAKLSCFPAVTPRHMFYIKNTKSWPEVSASKSSLSALPLGDDVML